MATSERSDCHSAREASGGWSEGRCLYRHPQLDRVVRSVNQVLPGAEISLRRLHRSVAEEQVDLFKLATAGPAQLRADPVEIMGRRLSFP